MKKNVCTYAIFSLIFLLAHPSYSQKAPIKFGKIDREDLQMTHYPLDSSAHAVVLCDYGVAQLEYDQNVGQHVVNFHRHIRYKVIDKKGYDYANYSIPLYNNGRGLDKEEVIVKFKAISYNLVDGKMEETKIGKKELISAELSNFYTEKKVAIPKVREGTIFEIEYATRSPFYWNLESWQFQYTIPVKHSEYRVEYPEWFTYEKRIEGYDFDYLTIKDTGSKNGSTIIASARQPGGPGLGNGTLRTAPSREISFRINTFRYVAENMPAFQVELYTSNISDYLTAIRFELGATNFPGNGYRNFNQTWEVINKELMEHEFLGQQLTKLKIKSFKDDALLLKGKHDKEIEQIAAIYNHVKKEVLWNGTNNKYVNSNLKKILNEGKGNTAEINLLLSAMLKAAGFEANPVLLSTRSNGLLRDWSPGRSQFNYLISAVRLTDGQYILLDATDRTLPMNVLPPRCINGKGMMLTKEGHTWLNLNPTSKYRHVRQVKAKLNEELAWQGTMDVKCKDYAARAARESLKREGGEKEYMQMLENDHAGLALTTPVLTAFETLSNETKESYEVNISDNVTEGGNLLYFNPMLLFAIDENPFKLKERKYPVDYNYPHEYIYVAAFDIPEGYMVEELPEGLTIALPEQGGRYSYSLAIRGNTINVTSQLKISKHLFLPNEYAALKEFYNLIVDKMAGQVVLKKKV